jgi:cell division septum initiation protein DivIVA
MSDDDALRQAVASIDDAMALLQQMHRENEELRALITELEAELALLRGSLARPDPDEPAQITHNHPSDAPR